MARILSEPRPLKKCPVTVALHRKELFENSVPHAHNHSLLSQSN